MAAVEPTFVIAGAQRAGTTTLYQRLAAHPQVFMAGPVRPEPKYFVEAPRPGRDRDTYLETWFAGGEGHRAVGEKSTSYFEVDGVAARMRAEFPELKLVFVLRHPVERAVSNYRFSVREGHEPLSFVDAIAAEESRRQADDRPAAQTRPYLYGYRGRYLDRLAPFREAFDESALCVLLFEDVIANDAKAMRRLAEFLDVENAWGASAEAEQANASPDDEVQIDRNTVEALLESFRDGNERMGEWLGRDLSHWNHTTPALERLFAR